MAKNLNNKSGNNKSYWIYGLHPVNAALDNPSRQIFSVIATQNALAKLHNDTKNQYSRIIKVVRPEEIASNLPKDAVHQGIAALVEPIPELDLNDFLEEIENEKKITVIALDQVTDPHNVGAVIRSAAAFGAAAVILTERNSPEQTATLIKSSAGMVELVPIVRVTNLSQTMDKLKKAGFFCLGLAGEANDEIDGYDFPNRTALIMGSEGEGLRRLTRDNCDVLLKIKMAEGVESLNISNAAAIALHEIFKA